MTTFQLVKTMSRRLTADEETELLAYLKAHDGDDIDDVIKIFELKFGTPITRSCVTRLALTDMLRNR